MDEVTPNALLLLGGTITIKGDNFQQGVTVKLGNTVLTNVVVADKNTITATVPALTLGIYDLSVQNTLGLVGKLLNAIQLKISL